MKKILFVVLAAVGLASCVQTEELGVANNKEAIGFDPFVDNATKASAYDNNNLSSFQVYGTISQNGAVVTNIFDGVTVTKNGSAWTYSPEYTQYWVAGFTYNFAAVVDAEVVQDTNGMPATLSTNLQEQKDVLYDTESREFNGGQTSKVSFTFAHLLSKAKFTVKNTISEGTGFVYNVESVKITNADNAATYDVATSVWTATNTYEADFGVATSLAMGANVVSQDVLLLPSNNKNLEIEVAYNLTYNGATLKEETKTLNAVLTLEKGKAYNFIVEFGNPGEEIEFEAVVDGWVTDNLSDYILEADGFGKHVNTGIYHIQNLAGFEYFAAQVNGGRSFEGQTVVLDSDIDISATRSLVEWAPIGTEVANCFEGTFDGQDHTISNFQVNREGHAGLFGYARATFKNLSVENVTLVAHHYAGGIVGQGYVKLDECHAKNVNITLSAKNNDWSDKAGGIVGQLLEGATLGIQNSTVNNVTIEGYRDLGGVAGMAHNNNFVKNCSATNVTIIHNLTDGYQSAVPTTLGAVVGRYGSNVTTENIEGEAEIAKPVSTWAEFTTALANGATTVFLKSDIEYAPNYELKKSVNINLGGNSLVGEPTKLLYLKSNVTIKNGTVKGVIYSHSGDVTISNVKFTGPTSRVGSVTEGQLNIKGGNVLVKDCTFSNTSYTGAKPRCVSIEGRSSGSIKFENCKFNSTNLERLYANQIKGTAKLEFLNCTFSIAPVFAMTSGGLYSNILFNGCTSSMGLSFEMYDRTSTTGLTTDENAIVEAIFQNNKISSAKLYYSDKTVTKRK